MIQYDSQVAEITKELMGALTVRANRKVFFGKLSKLLQKHVFFDRLCINLYDQQGEMLTYFTAAEGTIVSTLSPVRPAEVSSTVAGHVIATRKPVIITDFAQYFSESSIHPIAEAGLTATMAFPLILDNEIIATLHCSFAKTPKDIYDIASFLLELSPLVATCLGAILSLEQLAYNEAHLQVQPLSVPEPETTIICHSKLMREVMRKINAVAKLDVPVLLLGETGTGKSQIAREIHRHSLRKDEHFVKVNCPSLPQTLFESELFGHAKGAFTGAANKRTGRFELAHKGTLLLDEIAELTPEMQSKLLQVLEESSFERVGESVSLAVNVRIIAATNVRIAEALAQGTLRADLFHRVSLCTIELPPLRERYEDIPLLVTSFLTQMTTRLGLPPVKFTKPLIEPLLHYHWPGNVRELRNVVSRLVIHNSIYKQLTVETVEAMVQESRGFVTAAVGAPKSVSGSGKNGMHESTAGASGGISPSVPEAMSVPISAPTGSTALFRGRSLEEVERQHILDTLAHTNGVIAGSQGAAALLGLPRSTLQHRMRKLGITKKAIA